MSQLNQNSIALEELKTKAASLPAAITIDSTLTQSGQAADAKATGDAIAAVTLTSLGVTATAAELNYVDGVTSNIQTQLNAKAASTHNHAATEITSGTLPVARGGTGNTSVDTTPTSGSTKMVTSGGVYTALSGKADSSHNQAASTITAGTFAGAVVAQTTSQTPATSLLRNSKLVTADTNPSNNGEICWTYE